MQIKTTAQLDAALSFFGATASEDFKLNEFEEACGVGMKKKEHSLTYFRCSGCSIHCFLVFFIYQIGSIHSILGRGVCVFCLFAFKSVVFFLKKIKLRTSF